MNEMTVVQVLAQQHDELKFQYDINKAEDLRAHFTTQTLRPEKLTIYFDRYDLGPWQFRMARLN